MVGVRPALGVVGATYPIGPRRAARLMSSKAPRQFSVLRRGGTSSVGVFARGNGVTYNSSESSFPVANRRAIGDLQAGNASVRFIAAEM